MGRRLPRALSPADIYKKLYVDDVDGKERSKKAKIYIDEIIAEALPENSPYKKPNRDALDDLAVRLADIFFWHPIFASTVPPSHDLLDAASAVVAPLREHIELIQKQQDLMRGDPKTFADCATALDHLRTLEAAISAALPHLPQRFEGSSPPTASWHGVAFAIEQAFRRAMKTTNPKVRLGLSNAGGPVVRFVAAALRWGTGEDVTEAAVAKYLIGLRKRQFPTRSQSRELTSAAEL